VASAESVETTHRYLEADLVTKEKALAKLAPPTTTVRRFKADDALLGFLAGLCLCRAADRTDHGTVIVTSARGLRPLHIVRRSA
jgi:hypothetical protein